MPKIATRVAGAVSRLLRGTPTQRVIRAARRRGVTVYSRGQWGSRQGRVYADRRRDTARGRWGRFIQPADTVVQHITVTTPSGDVRADARTVEQIGMERFGSGVSYNWLVDMTTGEVCAGQPLDSKGTHTVNDKGVPGYSKDQNLVARAIAVIGQPGTRLSPRAEMAIGELLAAHVDAGAITPGFDYVPHSLFAAKDCPCDATRNRMAAIRDRVTALVGRRP
ncbi:hypothetical protein GCM10023340_39020 [Nocardioides marinquilinus]|uniref:N-acetylmuramoyl-L-alanine amidase domain-containing protein n=1 Tax=Nocardioides marinquilinus TaxID=1210400 RepID=A0ABP9PZP8_9ACTN